ncbi:RNA polymerase sigma factor, sigma-70 family [Tannerella forsythia KS16]|jgi:RNA polymerase sigma factor, sigma-70 family|uniref:RNA polymerase sigma factor, sigma-70 family n=2 Tax=Tannerella forsythia TaxID=28112 RepID=G8UIX3_TANFA|nr:sigma-70 family RNA polymerase sigma factor [Tannerella forsythia]AEW19856.1 RNA polymerase sigma factor, sigma-70 family [Tannerella forsythia 92A2]KKY61109.1 RNA polymerase sigma factor [Tannerella forsythia]OLQ21856.1 RNA polymerase subunit sigma [Tannerella forsythia]PDP70427.1 RNA polymerase subunit sigma [Tannerella forsythia]TPE17285.1 sigma-70 family RNA polymerase sigma factor [Tannerella forsythia]
MNLKDRELNKWIERYSRPLLERARYLLSDKEDAMDMVQEVFITAHSAYHTFQGKSDPLTWLYNILRNKTADFYRKKYKAPSTISLSHFFDETGFWKDGNVLNYWNDDTDHLTDNTEFNDTLENCIDRLPPKWKLLVKLYYLQEKKAIEICQEIGLTTTNLWKVLQRSRLQLRECLERNWFEQ